MLILSSFENTVSPFTSNSNAIQIGEPVWDPPLFDLTMVLSRSFDGVAAGQRTQVLNYVPDMLIRFHLRESGHAAQPDSVLHNPEQFSVRVLLHLARNKICGPRVHPSSLIGRRVPIQAVTIGTVDAEQFVALVNTRLPVGRSRRNDLAACSSPNENAQCRGGDICFRLSWLRKSARLGLDR